MTNLSQIIFFISTGLIKESFVAHPIQSGSEINALIDGPIHIGAHVVWQMFSSLTGTYIFNLLSLFGIYAVLIAVIVGVYYILLGHTLSNLYLRGVNSYN